MSLGLKSRAGCEGGEEERSMEPEIQTGEAVRQEKGGRQRAGKGPKAVRRNDTGVLTENDEADCSGEVSGAGGVSECKTSEQPLLKESESCHEQTQN